MNVELFKRLSPYVELSKPRISSMALLMTALGFVWGSLEWDSSTFNFILFAWTMLGTGLLGVSCGVLNQYLEIDLDKKMIRTQNRPLPTGKIDAKEALVIGWVLGIVGMVILLFFVNSVAAVLGALTFYLYLGIYTPGKLVSPMSTLVGAFPGAIPPLIGWVAATGGVSINGLLLFFILFLWQMPHFFALAWVYRNDYARANIKVLPVVDKTGNKTVIQALIYSLLLLFATLLPAFLGLTGPTYFWGALVTGILFSSSIVVWFFSRSEARAKQVFQASLIYLPLLGGLLLLDNTF